MNSETIYIYSLEPISLCHRNSPETTILAKIPKIICFPKGQKLCFRGLLILCHKSISAKPNYLIPFQNGVMEYQSIQYGFQGKWNTLILLYNPCKNLSENEINHYLSQVDTTGIVCGDLNAHHETWELNGLKLNPSGKSLFNVLTRSVSMTSKPTRSHNKDWPLFGKNF